MPSWAVREEIETGKLAQVRIEKSELKRSVAMVSLKGRNPRRFAHLSIMF